MPVIEVDFKNICPFCHKREATKLCDKVIGEYTWAGHPPKVNGKMLKIPMSGIDTCDRPICDKCATHIDGMDICPRCLKRIKKHLEIK